jgi:hypothetical protein
MKLVKHPAARVMPMPGRRSAELVGGVGLVVKRTTMAGRRSAEVVGGVGVVVERATIGFGEVR